MISTSFNSLEESLTLPSPTSPPAAAATREDQALNGLLALLKLKKLTMTMICIAETKV
jgi:hypothetical protein